MTDAAVNYRFSGHETFPCRYTWLPKAVQSLAQDPALFYNEDQAMVTLGVGKNMVRAIRFWADAAGVSVRGVDGASIVSSFGADLLSETGYDPFLEDAKTLWLIHWKIATSVEPLFAWDYLLNSWHRPDFTRSEAVQFLAEEASRIGKKLSHVTLENHFTTFLHTYVPTRSKKGEVLDVDHGRRVLLLIPREPILAITIAHLAHIGLEQRRPCASNEVDHHRAVIL